MANRKEIEKRLEQFERKVAPLQKTISNLRREIALAKREVNRASSSSVDAFNKKVGKYNVKVANLTRLAEKFNEEQHESMSPELRAQQVLQDATQMFVTTRKTPQQIAEHFGLKVSDVVKAVRARFAVGLLSNMKVTKNNLGFGLKHNLGLGMRGER